jgi:transposase
VARRHGVNANQVFHWRKLLREGLLDRKPASAQLMPVHITEVLKEEHRPTRLCSGAIHIELGRARLRVEGSVDPDSLRLILEHLGR